MKAIQIQEHNGIDGMQVVDIPKPDVPTGKFLIKMLHASINPADIDVAAGRLPFAKQPPLILGTEGTGIVEKGDERFPEGTKVLVYGGLLGIVQDGTWCEYLVADASQLHKVPDSVNLAEVAGMPLVYLTAQASLTEAGFQGGGSVLITGAGGGVGNAAYQLAILQGASKVIATAGSSKKKAMIQNFIVKLFARPIMWSSILSGKSQQFSVTGLRDFHKSAVIDLSNEDFEQRVAKLTNDEGPQYIIDVIGGDYLPRLINMAAPGASLALVGYKAGLDAEINLMPVLAKQLKLFGINVFNLPPHVVEQSFNTIFDLVNKHGMRPLIDKQFALNDAATASQHLMTSRPFGKVILNIGTE